MDISTICRQHNSFQIQFRGCEILGVWLTDKDLQITILYYNVVITWETILKGARGRENNLLLFSVGHGMNMYARQKYFTNWSKQEQLYYLILQFYKATNKKYHLPFVQILCRNDTAQTLTSYNNFVPIQNWDEITFSFFRFLPFYQN